MSILNYIVSLDFKIEQLILPWRTTGTNDFFFIATLLGNYLIIILLFIIVALFLKKYHHVSWIKPFIIVLVGSSLTTLIIKFLVNRSRPSGAIPLYVEKLSSFPSAHATLAMALFGFLIYIIYRLHLSTFKKTVLIIINILIILLVGFSRLYLGVHYFSDVLAGYLVGLIWILVIKHLAQNRL
jgi:undecaprenyl-diphosphatase